jgi:hypothetical protein
VGRRPAAHPRHGAAHRGIRRRALAPDIVWLSVFRCCRASAPPGGVVAMAMVRDLFGGKPLVACSRASRS